MQSKGAIKFVAIILLFASLYQLSFTFVANKYEKKADKYAETKVAERLADTNYLRKHDYRSLYMSDERFEAELRKEDSLKFARLNAEEWAAFVEEKKAQEKADFDEKEPRKARREFTDSISEKKIFLGETFKGVQAKALNLGLDLKGGMSVVLQVQVKSIVKVAAKNQKDTAYLNAFNKAFNKAEELSKKSQDNFVDIFSNTWDEVKGDKTLAKMFNMNGSDSQILNDLKKSAVSAVDNSFNVISRRVDRLGVVQPNIQKIKDGSGRILVELPGVKDPERVRQLLQSTASLEFRTTLSSYEVWNAVFEAEKKDTINKVSIAAHLNVANAGNACLGYAHHSDTAEINQMFKNLEAQKLLTDIKVKPMWSAKPSNGKHELVAIYYNGAPELDGDAVSKASANINQDGSAEVSMEMNKKGAKKWADLTGNNVGKQIAIVLDGLVYSYPVVNQKIEGGMSSITGNFSVEEAQDLANVLQCGKLPAPATIIQETVVGPSLGAKSINAGLISFVIAFVLVLLYMILFYSRAGLAADIALLFNVILLFGTLASFGAVLTLPGIAGLVLTLGMAVDANVIIYERVKEELRAGKSLSKAIADGYSNAYSAIIDGQITTLLTGIVLFRFGSGPVQGFATTLIIGIVTSIVTSIFITRVYFEDRLAKGKNITFDNKLTRNFLQNTKINFLGKKNIAYLVSGLLILGSLGSIFTKGFTYGIDFVGGRSYVVKFDKSVDVENIRKDVSKAFSEEAKKLGIEQPSTEVKQFGGDNQVKITTTFRTNDEGTEADAEVVALLFNNVNKYFQKEMKLEDFESADKDQLGIVSSDKVGAAIAAETKRSAFIAVGIALLVIFAYIAIRFKKWTWGLGGVLGLAHTAIIVIGFFSLFTGILPFNLDVDQTFIAAILTIIGYAINDTVVIFDRIREFKTLHPKADFKQNVNEAINSTLSRTMNTSLTTLVTMLAIAIFGGEAIRGLAVALILGIIIGTYASIFIATPIMYDLTKKAEKRAEKKAAKKAAKNAQN